ncbi:MAG: hypothetical protein SGILL_007360 [Bacillariaceae sp.]
MRALFISVVLIILAAGWTGAFVVTPPLPSNTILNTQQQQATSNMPLNGSKDNNNNELEVMINAELTDERITSLFAWVSRAFRGDPEYNNLMLAIAAIWGNLPEESLPVKMAEKARESMLHDEEELVGDEFSIEEREYNSLG